MKYLKSKAKFDAHQRIVTSLCMIENIIREKNNKHCEIFDIIKENLMFAEMRMEYIRGKKWDKI